MFQALRWRPIMCGPSRPLRPRDGHLHGSDECGDGVPIAQILSATFNEAMNCTTLASPATTFMVTGPGATAVSGQ